MENRETLKRLNATAAGLGASGLLGGDVGEAWGSGTVAGEDGLGINGTSSSHSKPPPECTHRDTVKITNSNP